MDPSAMKLAAFLDSMFKVERRVGVMGLGYSMLGG